ncbi:MAG: hypothetical protein A2600_03655 [Candidatus Lambdaproteobacteria bacterium RIFOXYD1_FULL_56_27]|uniref:UPF0301 protein A2557_07720 n=1 Tax=Candidatus Lambdaproteobacteria bacterium RIFOXYD2_FULL_56_26 TaxID=1817773 RepID=A0A1F6H3A6_9PROT|nr:MAG: hypothetical protein A2426_11715 [Candidatus Lambdaproteobacteria bacterium RIFOXYC1_FULL_56_13]OGH04861.1 MAG: hypothetical protein A2557_07720 [Candidatus Lambdaproteobacteria bacterium RIFOXYD2_FULL_56_26]OGH09326.1 MAG: hypothetical protein A2600_03655 [Candidatus Lambdaproteobacteria bacterium RIFOXYD1_FULL_56_27]
MGTKKASFLIAMPSLQASMFAHSVILMAENNEDGALGFIVNQETGAKLDEALALLNLHSVGGEAVPLLLGGPVQTDFFWLLHEPTLVSKQSMLVSQDYVVSSASEVLAIAEPKERPLIYLAGIGYAGWGPGQLEREIEEGAWWQAELGLDLLLETPLADRWQKAFEALGVEHLIDNSDFRDPVVN